MNTATTNHLTFLSCNELLLHLALRCRKAEHFLRTFLEAAGERDCLVTSLVADAEHQLAIDLVCLADNAPEHVLSTRIQYLLDEREAAHPGTIEQALENVTMVNGQLSATLRDLKYKTAPEDVRELFDMISREVDAVNRRISTIRTTALDL